MSSLQLLWTYILLIRDFFIGNGFLTFAFLLPLLQPDRKNLTGQTAIVTGSNSGVGYGIALQLAEQGATVVLACRNKLKAEKARAEMVATHPKAKVDIILLDTSSFASVRSFAKACREKYQRIDILVHNAGISSPSNGDFSEDGLEIMYQTNFLSSFLLTHLLESQLSDKARIIFTTSVGGYFGAIGNKFSLSKTTEIENGFHSLDIVNSSLSRYGQTKLMQAAFAKALQSRFDRVPGNQRLAFSFEPGLVKTNIFAARTVSFWEDPAYWTLNTFMPYTGIDRSQGAATGVHLATSDQKQVLANSGRYFDRMKARVHWIDTMSTETLDRLWIRWSADCEISWTG